MPRGRKRKTEDKDLEVDEEEVIEIKKKKISSTTKKKQDSKATKNDDKCEWKEKDLLCYYTNSSGSTKIAAFDMDGTLIETKSGEKFPKNRADWRWWDDKVPERLKKLNEEGYKIVIFTNQGGVAGKTKDPKLGIQLRGKIEDIIHELGFHVHTFMATGEDIYRKPSTAMWNFMNDTNGGIEIDKENSFYVGDAAGRAKGWQKGQSKDFSCGDRKFAFNIGLPFHTPEEFFLKQKVAKFDWDAINIEKVLAFTGEEIEGEITSNKPEVVVFVGYPASGKSTMAKKFKGYVHVNQDTLKDYERCLRTAKAAINDGKSVVVDNTNPSLYHRKPYVQYAKAAGWPTRCFLFPIDLNFAKHLNYFRERKGEKNHVPGIAFNKFRGEYEEPALSEGFSAIKKVRFIPKFAGDAEKALFCQYA